MEFAVRGDTLLITENGKLIDRVRIRFAEETGNGRILHVSSMMRTENRYYEIREVSDETWQVLSDRSLEAARENYRPGQPTLTLEIE